MRTITIRASSTDRAFACPGSLSESETPNRPDSIVAREGSAGHEVCAHAAALFADGRPLSAIDIPAVAARHGVAPEGLEDLPGRVCRVMRELTESCGPIERIHTEVEFFPMLLGVKRGLRVRLSGTADLVIVFQSGAIIVLDWKLGRAGMNEGGMEYPAQIRSYAWLYREQYLGGLADDTPVAVCEAFLRLGTRRIWEPSRHELEDHCNALVEVAAKTSRRGAGDHCVFCPHEFDCAQRGAMVKTTIRDTMAAVSDLNSDIANENLHEFEAACSRLEAIAKRGKALVRRRLADGPIRLADGREMLLAHQRQDKITPALALPIIDGLGLTDDERNEVLSVSKGRLQAVVASKAGRGKKEQAKREIMQQLREAGAVGDAYRRLVRIVDCEE